MEGRVKDVIKRAEMALNISSKDLKDLSVRDVRDVAPQKMYMCIEFELPRGCKTSSSDGRGRDHEDDEFPKSKRMKVESDDGQ